MYWLKKHGTAGTGVRLGPDALLRTSKRQPPGSKIMWPFRRRSTVDVQTGDLIIALRHIEATADHLARSAALSPRDGILFEHFVEGDAWYDQGPLAVSFGLDRRYADYLNVVYSYLGLMFFLAADNAIRAGFGHLEARGPRMYFMLTEEGRKKYPSPRDGEGSQDIFERDHEQH
jgi:hypothetical protein